MEVRLLGHKLLHSGRTDTAVQMSVKLLGKKEKSYGFVSGEKDGFYTLFVLLFLHPTLLFHSEFENKISYLCV